MRHGSQRLPYRLKGKRIWIAGHRGMVGSALCRRLESEPCELVTESREKLDLMRQSDVEGWLKRAQPDVVVIAAAKVGGILANDTRPVEFLRDNLLIETNVIAAAFEAGVEKLLLLGSSCIYPKMAPQPIPESALLTGPLEPTNQWYAIAKIAGLKLVQAYRKQYGADFITAMPTNLYGRHDNFDLETSHVLPALIAKAHQAKQENAPHMVIWGSGNVRREFLHVDDCADALLHILTHMSEAEPINVGTGEDVTITELAQLVAETVGFEGDIVTDTSKPDGTPRKMLDVDKLKRSGWRPRIGLKRGIADTYEWYKATLAEGADTRVSA
jgi:GDP-L-fucose synthase